MVSRRGFNVRFLMTCDEQNLFIGFFATVCRLRGRVLLGLLYIFNSDLLLSYC